MHPDVSRLRAAVDAVPTGNTLSIVTAEGAHHALHRHPHRRLTLGCSVADLTGQPYLPVDRRSAGVAAAVTEVSAALHDATLADVPDIPARPVAELAGVAALVHACADDAHYGVAGRGLAALLTELHVHSVARIHKVWTASVDFTALSAG